ncbi:peptidoglycan-binding protein [Anabaena cylindrica FACHB-243]|uniref:Lysozyme n=1 Tax=Anabaena cylindrica (strain ATCC 27899 / PCC 7122) TaxID=272123 RepID=K9ZAY1_ANACC|nr:MULTISPECIES: peptidoglycan-binding protein [Anabaena]AFZ56358.1 Peptidoglycan-binding domain 1 protein [Anabaena cylindrica PCC 7122]MBD2418193.1 peptidoglycan-binding protein [Anabaena cylindrica FACHB-243]MBY5283957.1 glycoside hydrolase family protein [Anabaena sp. CCAP 1446/1C]MBY5308021.1 glycoside hydrolase family protein [Anabaena sp. CCAP 1446/1C]MCM2409085.1 peptidoglycan-binding protein [Anabaena sp. CCAP 1446/1C]
MITELILNPNQVLRLGSKGVKVEHLQQILKALNLDPGLIDGDFGNKTLAAVQQFQQQQRLEADGIVGVITQNALNQSIANLNQNFYGGKSGKLPLSGISLIKEFEGLSLEAYPDPDPKNGGKPITIGWGTTRKKDGSEWKLGEKITKEEAEELLISQLENNYLPSLQKIPVWNELNPNQQGALLSFCYNLGANFYGGANFQSITRVLKNQQWDEIEETFVKYRSPGSLVEEGLKRRRLAEAKLFLTSLPSVPY